MTLSMTGGMALWRFVIGNRTRLERYAFRRLSDRELACDVVTEAALRASRKLTSLSLNQWQIEDYLFRSIRHLCMDIRKSGHWQREHCVDFMADGPFHVGSVDPMVGEYIPCVWLAVKSLPGILQPCVYGAYWLGLEGKEMATMLGISEAAVKMRLTRARKLLRVQQRLRVAHIELLAG